MKYKRSVFKVNRTNLFDSFLCSGHRLLLCGLYYPPKHKDDELDVINYIVDLADNALDTHPDTVFVSSSDVNKLDLSKMQLLSGLNVLVDFPTRGIAVWTMCSRIVKTFLENVTLLIC